jgi:hypothetical protein
MRAQSAGRGSDAGADAAFRVALQPSLSGIFKPAFDMRRVCEPMMVVIRADIPKRIVVARSKRDLTVGTRIADEWVAFDEWAENFDAF